MQPGDDKSMLSIQTTERNVTQFSEILGAELYVFAPNGSLIAPQKMAGSLSSSLRREKISDFADSSELSWTSRHYALQKVVLAEETLYVVAARQAGIDQASFCARVFAQHLADLEEAYREKLSHNVFFQNLLLDNLLRVDIINQARRLRIDPGARWAVVVFKLEDSSTQASATELLGALFQQQNGDYLVSLEEDSVILIREMHGTEEEKKVSEAAHVGVDMLETETMITARAGYGTVVNDLIHLSNSYKEARMAIEVSEIFRASARVTSYDRLGIGRLVYQLPERLCRMFLQEVFADNLRPDELDQETLATVEAFFENNLNISETSRKLFLHRNTLVYRIEKLARECGLDVRNFDDAVTFRIALMVSRYLDYLYKKEQ